MWNYYGKNRERRGRRICEDLVSKVLDLSASNLEDQVKELENKSGGCEEQVSFKECCEGKSS